MKEELIVTIDGQRYNVDLPKDSGITLSYESNLFNSLSDINCNRSYTFKLPLTLKNRRIFDMSDDVRHHSSAPYHRIDCEYRSNGVLLFDNANLYIENIEDGYNAVMTWNVLDCLQKIKDNDKDINDLYGDTTFDITPKPLKERSITTKESYFDNFTVLRPLYSAGIDVDYINEYLYSVSGLMKAWNLLYPLPVIPVPKIIKLIEDEYDISIPIYTHRVSADNSYSYEYRGQTIIVPITTKSDAERLTNQNNWETLNIVDLGCVPCVSVAVPKKILHDCKFSMSYIEVDTANSIGSKRNIVSWLYCTKGDTDFFDFYTSANPSESIYANNRNWYGLFPKINRMGITLSGIIYAAFDSGVDDVSMEFTQFVRKRNKNEYFEIELESVVGEYDENPTDHGFSSTDNVFIFDFRKELANEVELNGLVDESFIVQSFTEKPIKFASIHAGDGIIAYPSFDEGTACHKMNSIASLPSISCLTFLKSLFYIIGAFPVLNKEGQLCLAQYSDIETNLVNENVVDWSNKIVGSIVETKGISFSLSQFGKSNNYRFKNDEKSDKDEDNDDVNQFEFESSLGIVKTNSVNADDEKDIASLPFYGKYISNNFCPDVPTGDKVKYWVKEKGSYGKTSRDDKEYVDHTEKLIASEASPVFGQITFETNSDLPDAVAGLGMNVVSGFKNMTTTNKNYKFLQRLVLNPIVFKAEFMLSELDLANLDFLKPVYISRYAAYFCIVKIDRRSTGISEVELLKIPNN